MPAAAIFTICCICNQIGATADAHAAAQARYSRPACITPELVATRFITAAQAECIHAMRKHGQSAATR